MHDWDAWITFVVYAVTGLVRHADEVLRRHEAEVVNAAAQMRAVVPIERSTLHRGLLLEPDVILKNSRVAHDDALRFISYTEDIDVACWFAHPSSIISQDVMRVKPSSEGYISTLHEYSPQNILWRHQWTHAEIPGRRFSLLDAAALHPDPNVNVSQFYWNMTTQREVLMLPPTTKTFHVARLDTSSCKSPLELDARLTFPAFR